MKKLKIFLFILLAFFVANVVSVSATEVTGSVTVTVVDPVVPVDPAIGNLTISPLSCVISLNASTCTAGATWTTSNTTSPALVNSNTGATLSTLANNSSSLSVVVSYPQTVFNLKDGANVLDTKTVTSSCGANIWDSVSSKCISFVPGTPPSISSPVSSSVACNTATLGANVTSIGSSALTAKGVCYRAYGTPSYYPSDTNSTCVPASSIGGTGAFTVNVTGLSPSTSYNFVGYASNASGPSQTSSGSFSTGACAPQTPTIQSVVSTSPCYSSPTGSLTITWNAVSGATSYTLSEVGGSANVYTGPATGYVATGLALLSTHSYRVRATNSVGSSATSVSVSGTVGGPCASGINLVASAPTPNTATVGTSQTFSSTITNSGTAGTGASFSNFFQVATAANGGGTISDKSSSSMSALSAGGTGTSTVSHTFTSAGTYSIRACADKSSSSSTGVIAESNEGDNCSSWTDVTVPNNLPNLVASAPTPNTATVGTSQTFSSTITNSGTAGTGASFSNFFQVATAANGGGTISDKSSSSMSALSAGGTGTSTVSHTFTSAGTYSIRACADKSSSSSTGVIAESNEGDNCSSWTDVTVALNSSTDGLSVIDCAITPGSSTCPAKVTWNATDKSASITVTKKWGPYETNVSSWTEGTNYPENVTYGWNYFYLKKDWNYQIPTSGTTLAEASILVACAGGSSWQNGKCVSNNSFVDLVASDIVPPVVTKGIPQTFASRISNIGSVSTSPYGFYDLFEVSTTPSLAGLIQQVLYSSGYVDGNDYNIAEVNITFPNTGTFYVNSCADKRHSGDPVGDISEGSESNNCSNWVSVVVNNASSLPTTSCSASSYKINSGGSVNVIWTSTDATSCTLKAGADPTNLMQGITPSAGTNITKTLWPAKSVIYTLVCSGPGGNSAPCVVPEIKVGNIDPIYQEQ